MEKTTTMKLLGISKAPPQPNAPIPDRLEGISEKLVSDAIELARQYPGAVTDALIDRLLNENTVFFGEHGGHFNHVNFFVSIRAAIEADLINACAPLQQARMLTEDEEFSVMTDALGFHALDATSQVTARNLIKLATSKFCEVNTGKRIPADGKIGGAA